MRKKALFWALHIVAILMLSGSYAFAAVTPAIDSNGELIIEDVCDTCKEPTLNIVYSNCSSIPQFQADPTDVGTLYAFDRDAAMTFNGTTGDINAAGWESKWWASGLTTYSAVGFCNNTVENYLFAICNCDQKTEFAPNNKYGFEVEILTDGVYWADTNLSLYNDVNYGVVDSDFIGGVPYNNDAYNMLRVVVGPDKTFFCSGNGTAQWFEIMNYGINTWEIGGDSPYGGALFSLAYYKSKYAYLSYVAVKDYITRNYNPTSFSSSVCSPNKVPFLMADYGTSGVGEKGYYDCDANMPTAKVLRTHFQYIFGGTDVGGAFPVQLDSPYLYLDLPTMVYDRTVAELGDSVYVLITIVEPFGGVCTECCNTPICTCKELVGTFDCKSTTSSNKRCLPYYASLDDYFTGIVVSNMNSAGSFEATLTFYAQGESASITTGAIAPMSVWAAAVSEAPYITDLAAAGLNTGAGGYIEASVPSGNAFDVYYFFYNDAQFGMTSYLARCSSCSSPCESCTAD